ncbi:unconventional myosin-XIX [Xenopus tropicalis]|uniref:Unconventional myosin-XIX n=1 Tax=Xenopus tropicalis TaxID=8364 RepID=B3DM12_XENTR|nr:unconventional myosin-XIX [Xenopus tropicalis]AAI67661.1 LOC734140 protein [Xenopus tropicalis]|eukprot:NP_001122117.1 unconventional myosin-XIX [Xenopus tropicalis]
MSRPFTKNTVREQKQNNLSNNNKLNNSFEEEVKAFLIDEKQLHLYDDLTKVNPVTTATVLKCLQARYSAGVFYTNAGCTVVAVNPFRPVCKLYSSEVMKEYHAASNPQGCKPHIFTVAEQAYKNVQSQIQPVNQSIIVSGESGAGKTWTSRCLMKFYATVSASRCYITNEMVERIESRVLDSNPVMEAFGNACTLRNHNSSRFGKYIQLQLNRTQQITGASIQTYLLEKTRVAHQAPLERNFHIFYQVVKGASRHEREEWNLPEKANFSWLPNYENNLEEDDFEVTKDAMLHLGIDQTTQNNIFKILSGLLHLGNIQFSDSVDESQPCEPLNYTQEFASVAASLLKIPVSHLLERLSIRTITAGKQQVFKKPCRKSECDTRRDCLAKTIYARLFEWLVTVINENICAEAYRWNNFIGLLDVYGFESFPENNLEQLCINYANEKLQQHFVSHYLKSQQDEYAAEGLEWSFISYQDNQSCVDLIEGSPISIFSLLNEECRLNRSSDAGQLQSRLEKALSHNKSIGRDKFSKKPNFIVSHYAGKVQYQIEDMAEKNKDPVPPELIQLLQESDDHLLQILFPVENNKPVYGATNNRAVGVTVVSKFKGSLESLMQILHSTTPHYIRCIKPNVDCQALVFRQEEVLMQLEACGIVETINISAAGFPIRISFESFVERYSVIAPRQIHMENNFNDCLFLKKKQGFEKTDQLPSKLQTILHAVLSKLCKDSTLSNTLVHCGTTKVFLTHLMVELLEERRLEAICSKAVCIQCCWRRYRQRKLAKQNRAATTIQAAVKGWLTKKYIERMHNAATVIKRIWKKWKEKMEALAAAELDDSIEDVERTLLLSVPASPVKTLESPKTNLQDKLLTHSAILKFGTLGLVLYKAPAIRKYIVETDELKRNQNILMCLNVLHRNNRYKVTANCEEPGITSIRARPQGSIRFHYKRSPLHFANICPGKISCGISGFNEILLEKTI